MKKKYLRFFIAVFGLILSTYLLYQTDLESLYQSFQESIELMPSHVILVSFMSYIGSVVLRGIRYGLMIGTPSSIRTITESVFIGFAGNNILPARLGELLRTQYLYKKLNLARIDSLITIFTEKIFDLIIILSVFLLVLSQLFESEYKYFIILIMISIFFLLVYGRKILRFMMIKLSRLFPVNRIVNRFTSSLENVILNLGSPKNYIKIILMSISIWFLEWLLFWTIIDQLSITEDPLIGSSLALVLVNLSILIPSAPGYIGVFQAAFIYSISLLNSGNTENALVAAVIVHVIQYSSTLFIGGLIILLNLRNFMKKSSL